MPSCWPVWLCVFFLHCAQVLGRIAVSSCGNGIARDGERWGTDEVSNCKVLFPAIASCARTRAHWSVWPYLVCLYCKQVRRKKAVSGCGCSTGRDGERCGTNEVSTRKVVFLAVQSCAMKWAYWPFVSYLFCLHYGQVGSRRAASGCENDTMSDGDGCGSDEVNKRKGFFGDERT